MRRRLFNLLTMLSLVLCVAVCALWVRSYAVDEAVLLHQELAHPFQERVLSLRWTSGTVQAERWECYNNGARLPAGWYYYRFPAAPKPPSRRYYRVLFEFAGLRHESYSQLSDR